MANEYEATYFERKDIGLLFAKAFLKLFAIILLAIQLVSIHPFAAIALLFFAYFTLPAQYRIDQPYKACEAWFRPVIGIIIAIAIAWILTPGFSLGLLTGAFLIYLIVLIILISSFTIVVYTLRDVKLYAVVIGIPFILIIFFLTYFTGINSMPMATSVITISLLFIAFYAVPPVRIRWTENKQINVNITVIGGKGGGPLRKQREYIEGLLDPDKRSAIGNALFVSIMATALASLLSMSSGAGPTAGGISTITIITFVFWFISFGMGIVGGPLGRPYIGIMMVGLAILLFSYQYTGVVGTALFGAWWPPIEQGLSFVAKPIGTITSSVGQQMTCLQLMLTSPALYAATPGCGAPIGPPPKPIGSTRAIEITELQYINYATGEQNIDPRIPLIGSIQIENKGDFVANNINVSIGTIQLKDPTKVSAANPGAGYIDLDSFNDKECCTGLEGPDKKCEYSGNWAGNDCYLESCTGATDMDKDKSKKWCSWTDEAGIFPGYKALMTFKCGKQNDYNNWNYATATVTVGSTSATIYCPAGWFVSIPVKYQYEYIANASLPVEIMNTSIFQRKLLANEINPDREEKQATFTGGPVEISIWVQRQPLRSSETSYGKFIITNKGEGIITNLAGNLILQEPQGMKIVQVSKISGECTTPESSNKGPVSITLSDIKPNDPKICTFSFKYNIEDNDIEKKSTIFVAEVNYNYTAEKKVELQIANAPIQ